MCTPFKTIKLEICRTLLNVHVCARLYIGNKTSLNKVFLWWCVLNISCRSFVSKSVEKHIFYRGVRVSGGVVHIHVCNVDIFLLKLGH